MNADYLSPMQTVSDIFGEKAVASDVPPDSPGNGISCTAEVCAS